MYLNFNLIKEYNISLNHVLILFAANQNRTNDEAFTLEQFKDDLKNLFDLKILEVIKRKNKLENEYSLIRLSTKGKKILEHITTADITEDDIKLFDWLESVYISLDKEVGNKRKCKNFIAQFRINSGICKNHLAFLCQTFINDEKEIEFSQKLEFLFFKGANLFATKFDIYQSRLFQYYEKRKEFFENKFLIIKNEI
jgi:hypothetical protein